MKKESSFCPLWASEVCLPSALWNFCITRAFLHFQMANSMHIASHRSFCHFTDSRFGGSSGKTSQLLHDTERPLSGMNVLVVAQQYVDYNNVTFVSYSLMSGPKSDLAPTFYGGAWSNNWFASICENISHNAARVTQNQCLIWNQKVVIQKAKFAMLR